MPERLRSRLLDAPVARAVLPILILAVAGGLMAGLHVPKKESMTTVLAFVLFIAVGELLEVNLPWGTALVTMGLAPAVGFMLPLSCPSPHAAARACAGGGNGPVEVVAVFAAGSLIALAVRLVRRRDIRLEALGIQALTVVLASVAYAALARLDPFDGFGPANISYFGIAGVFVATIAADALVPSIAASLREQLPLWPKLRDQARASAALQVASVSVGALLALSRPTLGPWSFPLFLVPLVATQYSFRQFASIRTTYVQTIGALAKVPEMAGYTEPGHSRRVADLAVEIAQEIGVEGKRIEEIQYAALLHDIGRVSLPDPESANDSAYRLQVALEGAVIVKETGYLPGVATIIGQQHEPYRRRGEDQNREVEVGAKIVKVASAYDDLTNPPGAGRTPWDALEHMHLGMAYEYDPQVIQALTRVLEKRAAL